MTILDYLFLIVLALWITLTIAIIGGHILLAVLKKRRRVQPHTGTVELLKVEAAYSNETGDLIGHRLTITANGKTALIFADQENWPGFRVGSEFVPELNDSITYEEVKPVTE